MKNNIWRKCFAAVLSLMLLLSVALPTNATVLLGDVNGDGKLTVFDAQMLLESAFQLRNLTPEQLAAAGNATVSQLLESILGKKEEQTPVKEFVVPEGGYDGSPVTVTFYYNLGGDLPLILEKYCAQFQELYPSITVELINLRNFSGNHEQVLQDIAAGTTPNLVYNQAVHFAEYQQLDVLVPLDTLIESDIAVTRADGTTEILGLTKEQKDDFIAAFLADGSQFDDGLTYTLPFAKQTDLLYYNKTFFDQHGLKVPTTWDEMEEVCQQIQRIDPTAIPLGVDSEVDWFASMCAQQDSPYLSATGEHYLFDDARNHAFAERFNQWYQKGYMTTGRLTGEYYMSGYFAGHRDVPCYMSVSSSVATLYMRPITDENGGYLFEAGVAMLPQVEPADPKVFALGISMGIFQKEDPQEVLATWLLSKYLATNVDFQAEFAQASGYIPTIRSVTDRPDFAAYLATADGTEHLDAQVAKVCLEQQAAYVTMPYFDGIKNAQEEVGMLLHNCLSMTGNDLEEQIAAAFWQTVENCKKAESN